MQLIIAIDFGSTYTKVVAVDIDGECLVGWAQSISTVGTDITTGLLSAFQKLEALNIHYSRAKRILASSSAAGGLRVVAAGLVPELTNKAAVEASLGAGAKVIGSFPRGISTEDMKRLISLRPDLILLAGGTDGGDWKTMIQNAGKLASSDINVPIIIAGNKMAAQEAKSLLTQAQKEAMVVDNVLPELNQLNVESARTAIRETFVHRIVQAKGLDRARNIVGDIIMPTPMAILEGAILLARGTEHEEGLGDLIVVDVGGATTDVCSIGNGHPTQAEVVQKGLIEPYAKRTVEGDLGIRYNAHCILEMVGEATIKKRMVCGNQITFDIDLHQAIEQLGSNIGFVPQNEMDYLLDIELASAAVDVATYRHAGRLEEVYFPTGKVSFQYGKDLTQNKYVIGTGGIFAHSKASRHILQAACFDLSRPESLRPTLPEFMIDESYILFAVGLMAGQYPDPALRLIKKHLKNCRFS